MLLNLKQNILGQPGTSLTAAIAIMRSITLLSQRELATKMKSPTMKMKTTAMKMKSSAMSKGRILEEYHFATGMYLALLAAVNLCNWSLNQVMHCIIPSCLIFAEWFMCRQRNTPAYL